MQVFMKRTKLEISSQSEKFVILHTENKTIPNNIVVGPAARGEHEKFTIWKV